MNIHFDSEKRLAIVVVFILIFLCLLISVIFNHCNKIRIREKQTDTLISELNADLTYVKKVTVDYQINPQSIIYMVDDNKVILQEISNAAYASVVLNCREGEVFYYTGTHYNYGRQYSIIVTDNEGKVLLKDLGKETDEFTRTNENDWQVVIPTKGTKLIVQSYGGAPKIEKLVNVDIATKTENLSLQIEKQAKKLEDFSLKIEKQIEKLEDFELGENPCYDNVVRNIQRIGDGMGYPRHSTDAFIAAYKKGFRIMRCDLRFTQDDVPICNHDSYLNQGYKDVYDSDGNLVNENSHILFSENNYETLNQFYYGAEGYPLLKFTDMLSLVKQLGVELYVEVKGMDESQAKIACDLVKQYGISNKTSWSGTFERMSWIIDNIDTARVSLMPYEITDEVIDDLKLLKTGKNQVFIFGYDTTVLTEEIVKKLIENDIAFEMGTLETPQDVIDYFAQSDVYYYCTGVETNNFIAGKVLLENTLK